ncbi:MAG: glycosyltransferase [Salinivirgaceae bacterium]|nr:glycosyltransferase [Salinivirgaceae bacterium]
MVSIAVVLGTYNGEKYLHQQLDSILNQQGVSVQIFARDDGSKDSTVQILRSYAGKYSNFHLLDNGNTSNIGVRDGFMTALKWALLFSDEYDYFAFADQDDVWLPKKLISGVEKIRESTNCNGALYYSNKTIADENLSVIYQEHFIEQNNFSNFYFVSRAYGCTIVINRILADLSCRYVSKYAHFHDDWIHRLAICLNSDIYFDINSYILYRQHGDNNCGTFATDDKSLSHLTKRALSFIKNNDGYKRDLLASDILNNYGTILNDDAQSKLQTIADYKKKFGNRFRMIIKPNLSGRRTRDILIWRIKVLLGYF